MKQMELKNWGLLQLDLSEMREIDGGKPKKAGWLGKLIKGFSGIWIVEEVINNWDDIKKGLASGWNIDKPKK